MYQTKQQKKAEEMEKSLADLTKAVMDLTKTTTDLQKTVDEVKPSVQSLSGWKPVVEASIEALGKEMGELRQQLMQMATNPVLKLRPSELPGLMPTPSAPGSAALPLPPPSLLAGAKVVCDSPGGPAHTAPGPDGRRMDCTLRGKETRDSAPMDLTPVKGMYSDTIPTRHVEFTGDSSARPWGFHLSNLPRMDFLGFDGAGLRLGSTSVNHIFVCMGFFWIFA